VPHRVGIDPIEGSNLLSSTGERPTRQPDPALCPGHLLFSLLLIVVGLLEAILFKLAQKLYFPMNI